MSDFLVRAIHADELEQVADLVSEVYAQGEPRRYDRIHQFFISDLPHRPDLKLEHLYAGYYRGRMVSFARLAVYTLHYGRARLRVGGIAAVCTHPEYRKRGYSGAVLREILMYAAEQGMHMALLYGIPHYYERFGFIPVWPRYTLEASSEAASKLNQPLALREATPDDLPYIARLYNQHWGSRVTFSRSPALWQWRTSTNGNKIIVASHESGQIQGYIWHRDGDFSTQTEVIADSPDAVQTLFVYDGRRCHRNDQPILRWSVPPEDFIVPYAQQLTPITLSAHYTPTGNWMGRLIDSSAVIHTLLPEITAQAESMPGAFNAHDLLLEMQSDSVQIGLRGDKESHCRLLLRDFLQILFGSLRPATLAIRQHLHPQAVQLLERLFPPRIAAIAPWDWF